MVLNISIIIFAVSIIGCSPKNECLIRERHYTRIIKQKQYTHYDEGRVQQIEKR